MPDKQVITGTTVIVVDHAEKDGYGNLLVTDKGGGETRISVKRSHLFPIFQEGKAVELGWSNFMNKDYVAEARLVEGALPSQPATAVTPQPSPQQSNAKDKAVSLSYAKDLACAKIIGVEDMRRWANEFLKYIETGQ